MTERESTGAGRPRIAGVPRDSSSNPQAGWTWYWECRSPWSNQWNSPVDTQWNSTVDTTSNDPRQCGGGRDEVIPSFDGTDSHSMRGGFVSLCPIHGWHRSFVSHLQVGPECHFGSSRFLFKGALFFSASRAFLVLS